MNLKMHALLSNDNSLVVEFEWPYLVGAAETQRVTSPSLFLTVEPGRQVSNQETKNDIL